MDVQPGVGFVRGAREPRHHTADGAHQVTVRGQGLLGWHRTRTATVADARRARSKPHRNQRPIRAIQRLITASEALRAAHRRVVVGRETTGIQRDCPFVDRGHVPEHQPPGDFSRHETVYRIHERRLGRASRQRSVVAGHVAKEVVNFLVAAKTICETGPARPLFLRPEDGAEQGPHALRPDQHPRRARRDVPSIDRVVCFLQVVGADDDGEGRLLRVHRHPHRVEPPGELAGVSGDCHARCRKSFLGLSGRDAERGPVRRPSPFHREVA